MLDAARIAEIQARVAAADFAGAEAICDGLAESEGRNPAFWQMRGDIALMARKWKDAEAHYRWTTLLAPDEAKAWLGVARAAIPGGDIETGALAAERALALGLSADNTLAAQELVAHAKFSRGDIAGGRAILSALLPAYRSKLTQASPEVLNGALAAALCAGDANIVVQILRTTYPLARDTASVTIAPMASLESWCRDAGAPCTVIDQPREVALTPTSPYSRGFRYTTDSILFASIPGGQWIPGWDFALGSDGTVLEDSGYFKIDQVFNHAPHAPFPAAKLVAHRAPARTEDIDTDVLLVSAPMHNHLGHWLVDFVPRLAGRAADVKVAIPDTLTGAKFTETLAMAGVAERDIVRCRIDTRYRFRTMHVYRPGKSMPPHPRNVQYLRKVLCGDSTPRSITPGKRFFLSRARIGTRLAINAEAFEAFLIENGFISVELADLTMHDQRALFADAEVLLSAAGSDLLATYFAPPGCAVISMQWDMEDDVFAPPAAMILGMNQQFLLCPTTRPSKNARHGLDRDFVVDCDELGRRLREIEANGRRND